MLNPAVKFVLDVQAAIYKDGALWVAECPAFYVASQGKTKTEAREMLAEALELTLDTHRERGTFAEAIMQAAQHPTSKTSAAKSAQKMRMQVPVDLIAARHVEKATRRAAA